MIEAESQALLIILTEHDFSMHLKNGISAGNGTYVQKGTTSKVMVTNKSKVSFCPNGSNLLAHKTCSLVHEGWKHDNIFLS
jgi:hypothetical protein